ncbi:diaminohydroxyphosphoribosylaminopyrimidine deaminase/5-amino-6-(5-phosphoribosylamino)uracil reductase [Ruminiclostridium sufflavum DSM 19573]|uniref:Riboflavin biosynthesis protein RibD n=1 Tax=Ruminiclostridium sufflavum DSM 19573 TaxID=1121337 RepID=A0A318XS49_9FIRM|nr:bifunctional diaminohydroxyphosphoribosylaminopyrimidine deaminase/5-amino-6-(5-phosphoribosylamino)uracil reductase RibD [Ruminiclostridium sufflavum]PYG90354.1 diaminohydroxyphosphoribosylaminopyrimidine deaminase/5-amino-6-(5-phosphoribosylamino)uracil reductase [Ruminiclostridium sufflavum DSM 19573]
MNRHEVYMKRAIELAKGGWGKTNPNPLVGAVIVKDGEIIAEGFHKELGGDHAEAAALINSRQSVEGGTLYVNLEPCSHHGRTPPCAVKIIESKIKRVVVAMEDPNPLVAGSGIRMLREAGIEVVMGVLEKEAGVLNEIFIKYISHKMPFVIMKAAMTLDGKIASVTGDSKWISGESSRQQVHIIRDRVSAVMVGVNTVLTDNPELTTRLGSGEGRDPVRIVVDSRGIIPADSKAVTIQSPACAVLATTSLIEKDKEKLFKSKGVKVLKLDGPNSGGHVDLKLLMQELYKLEIDSVLLEGGGNLNAAALKAGIVDKVMFFISPRIIGGQEAKTPVEGDGIRLMSNAVNLRDINIRRFGRDILVEGYVRGEACLQEL